MKSFSPLPPQSSSGSRTQQPSVRFSTRPFAAPARGASPGLLEFASQGHLNPVIQTKMSIRQPGDKYEQEADRIAAQVVGKINAQPSAPSIQRQSEWSLSDPHGSPSTLKGIERKVRPETMGPGEAPTHLESVINRSRGSGRRLDAGLQKSMGQAMGVDFSGVKIHTDARSDQLNRSIQSYAFTTRKDIFFRKGTYKPESRQGQELIAHELTHVAQQGGSALRASTHSRHETAKNSGSLSGVDTGGQTVLQLAKWRRRPPSNSRRGQGDHVVAFSLMKKAVETSTAQGSVSGLLRQSKKIVKDAPANRWWHKAADRYMQTIPLTKKAKEAHISDVLSLLNQMPGTAVKNTKSTKGHGEGGSIGGLDHSEKQLSQGKEVEGNPWVNLLNLFDEKADPGLSKDPEKLKQPTNWMMTLLEHATPKTFESIDPRDDETTLDEALKTKAPAVRQGMKKTIMDYYG